MPWTQLRHRMIAAIILFGQCPRVLFQPVVVKINHTHLLKSSVEAKLSLVNWTKQRIFLLAEKAEMSYWFCEMYVLLMWHALQLILDWVLSYTPMPYPHVLLLPVLSTTSQTVHDASWSFKKIGRTLQIYFANSLKILSFQPAKESSGTLLDASGFVWLAGLDFRVTLTSCHWESDQLTMAHFAARHFYCA